MKHTVEHIKLDNGAEGLFLHIPDAQVLSYEFSFRAGEFLVEKNKWEVPHIMEHVILGANKSYPDAKTFQAELQMNGAYTNAFTGYYHVSYIGETADFEWERVLKLQLLALSEPLFLQKEFKAEWGNIKDELTSYCNNHFRRLGGELDKTFGFLHATDLERIELMKNVKRDDLIAHYKKTHFSSNMRFIIAGNLHARKKRLTSILESINIPRGKKQLELPVELATNPSSPVFIANNTVKNIYLYIDCYLNSVLEQQLEDSLSLARIMLTDTLHSKIFGQAREKGLVYSVNSNHHRANNYTEWWLSAQVLPTNAEALCEIIVSEIKKVLNGKITDTDITAAKNYALGSFQRSMQTVSSIAGAYNRFYFDGYIEDISSIPDRINAVTKDDMSRAMKSIFEQKIWGVGVLGAGDMTLTKQLQKQLSPLWN